MLQAKTWCSLNWKSPGVRESQVAYLIALVADRRLYVSVDWVKCVDGDVRDCHRVCIAPRRRGHPRFGADVIYPSLEAAGAMKGIMFIALGITQWMS